MNSSRWSNFFADYGMVFVLILLCALFSVLTWSEQSPVGADAGQQLARMIEEADVDSGAILISGRSGGDDTLFAQTLADRLNKLGGFDVSVALGSPVNARRALDQIAASGSNLAYVAITTGAENWGVFSDLQNQAPQFANAQMILPESYYWPDFLKKENLLNITNQIAVIAIIAIGMTMVIITGGIDLSVGSLIALSAVLAAWLIREFGGALDATPFAMTLGCLGAILACGLFGVFSGTMVTRFSIPPFIVTLAMMQIGSGLAYILAKGQSIYELPETFIWLGRGADLFGIPNAALLMLILYFVADFVMSRTVVGRRIYAVGGNPEAARLSGVPVKSILMLVYGISGALAGVGGVIMASQLRSGSPTYGLMYELYVIAAVVVGGASLSGGSGKIFGTLIGAFIIAVIRNGMNLTGVESYQQKVVLGIVILGAVLLDQLKKRDWSGLRNRRKKAG